jgi:capsular exopolysaccharide synthesis family protein
VSGFAFRVSPKENGSLELSDFRVKNEKIRESVLGCLGDTIVTPVGSVVIYPTANIDDFSNDIVVSWANSKAAAKAYNRKISLSLSGKESSVIVITMQDPFPSRSVAVLNSLIDVYNEEWISNKNRSAINTAEFINERLVVIEQELNSVEDALKNYKSSNNLTDIKAAAQTYIEESSLYATKAFEVTNQLSVAKYIKDYLNDPANNTALIPSNIGLPSPSVESQIKEYNELVLQRDRLLAASSIHNPVVADLNNSLSSIRTAILSSIENLIATLDLQLAKIESREKQITSRMSSSSGQELQLLSIERQQQMTQNLYVFLLQKREENELAALVNVGNTRMIMSPNGSSQPVAPNKIMILFIALVIGCGIPFAFFFLRKMLDNTIKDKSDLGRLTVPFLAEIPQDDSLVKKTFFGKVDFAFKETSQIIVEPGKRDMMNEAFRVFRTNIDLMIGKKSGSHVVMFTSFNPDAGKTFTLMNIAAGMAVKNSKVLMVDLDLRKASLSASLSKAQNGVAAYLNGKETDYHNCIEKISDNLEIMPAGILPPNPTELLLTDRFQAMISALREEYDYIFLDCPPIDIVADASIVTEMVDMTIFVLRAGLFDKRIIPFVEDLYKSDKYTHMAVILNAVDMHRNMYGYGNKGYGYGYGYGYGNKE